MCGRRSVSIGSWRWRAATAASTSRSSPRTWRWRRKRSGGTCDCWSSTARSGVATAPSCTVLLLGGRVRGRTLATVDHWATRMLAGFVLDLAFVGANGISREHGLTTPDPAVADVKAQVVQVARRLVFAGVHTKFGASSFCRFAEVADLETIITDTALPATEAHRYSLLGPHVLRV